MSEAKIGEPVPLGVITRKDVIDLGLDKPAQQVADQLSELKAQLTELRETLAGLSKAAAKSAEAHPLLVATVVSLGLWALIGLGSRRAFRTWR